MVPLRLVNDLDKLTPTTHKGRLNRGLSRRHSVAECRPLCLRCMPHCMPEADDLSKPRFKLSHPLRDQPGEGRTLDLCALAPGRQYRVIHRD